MSAALLSKVLEGIRLSGAMFLRGQYSAPWAFDSPEAEQLKALLSPDAERLILFHIVQKGQAWASVGNTRVELETGDVAILPYASRHLMGSIHLAQRPIPIVELLPPPPWTDVPCCAFNGGGEETEVVCGYLACDELLFNPFLRTLPSIFRVRPTQGVVSRMFRACVDFTLDATKSSGNGQAPLISRMPELLLIEALRQYANSPEAKAGWLAAAKDDVLGRAIGHLHAAPEKNWTVAQLASASHSSVATLDARFRSILRKPPMKYLTELRMQLAADALKRSQQKIAQIALAVGYSSEEGFSRAFKRAVGHSPSAWRKAKAGEAASSS